MAGFYSDIRITVDQILMGNQRSSKTKVAKRKLTANEKFVNKVMGFASSKVLTVPSVVLSKVGSYTGNKVQSSNINTAFKIGSYGIMATINPYVAIGKIAIDSIVNITDYNIKQINSIQETNYKTSLIGNSSTSNSRWRGNYK